MVYIMKIWVDGVCQGDGSPGTRGVAAAVFMLRGGRHQVCTRVLPEDPTPTDQRAEISAIILAQEQALKKLAGLKRKPWLRVRIHSDSRYAVDCMTQYKWCHNGWIDAAGNAVANQDLIRQASQLDNRLRGEGSVRYILIPKGKNRKANQYCNQALIEESD